VSRTWALIRWPVLITLAVTVLRVVGERQGWSSALFGRTAGGGAALLGISWLVPFFGAWFGLALARAGQRPAHLGRAAGRALLGLLVAAGAIAAVVTLTSGFRVHFLVINASMLVAAWIAAGGWPALGRTLAAYGVLARVPVIVVTALAVLGDWGTHYDAIPPNAPGLAQAGDWERIIWTGALPQLCLWIGYTVVLGLLAGTLAAALDSRRRAA